MIFTIETYSKAGKGKRNEDYHGEHEYADGSVLAVLADGMGDTDCARDAAVLAVDSILACFEKTNDLKDSLERAVMVANDRIADVCLARKCKMGCAVAVAYITEKILMYVSFGNVRIYLHKEDGSEECTTQDDIYVASNGNVFLTKSLSGKDIEGKISVEERDIKDVNEIHLSTDGCYNKDVQDDATEIIIRKK